MLWTIWDMIPLVVRKIFMAITGVAALIGLPIGFYLGGVSMEDTNIAGLNQSASYQHSPGLARARTPDWSTIGFIAGVVLGVLTLIFCLLYAFFAKGDKRSAWR